MDILSFHSATMPMSHALNWKKKKNVDPDLLASLEGN